MDILSWPIFSGSLWKKTKYMVSTPQRSQTVVFIAETGVVEKIPFIMLDLYMKLADTAIRKQWLVMHNRKVAIRNKEGLLENEKVLLVTENSYLPLDPFNVDSNSPEITPLTDIADQKLTEALTLTNPDVMDAKARAYQTVITGLFIFIIGIVVSHMIRYWGGK